MRIENLGGELAIHDAPPEVTRGLKRATSLPNPLWHKLQRMGKTKALYACPKEFKYWREEKADGSLRVGRGMAARIERGLKLAGRQHTRVDRTAFPSLAKKLREEPVVLRPYQNGVPEKILSYENGIVRLGTGFGKTVISLETIRRLGTPTLFIVPRANLLEQFVADARNFLGIDVGVIQGKRWDIGEITVATWQTLAKREAELCGVHSSFGAVFVDECHTAVTSQRLAILRKFRARYLYGLTATPRRTDAQGDAIGFTFGDILVDGDLPRKKPLVIAQPYDRPIPLWEYHEIIDEQVRDPERIRLVANAARDELLDGRRVLVLTKRVEHFERIADELGRLEVPGVHRIRSDGPAKERAEFLDSLRKGHVEYRCLVGTFALLSTGVDIPSLDTLVLAGDLKSDVLAEQSVGRILRLFEGKKEPKIIDIYDRKQPILYHQFRARLGFYQESGWEVTFK